jgi:hypothetical protein
MLHVCDIQASRVFPELSVDSSPFAKNKKCGGEKEEKEDASRQTPMDSDKGPDCAPAQRVRPANKRHGHPLLGDSIL